MGFRYSRYLIFILVFFISMGAMSQEKPRKLNKLARKAYSRGEYYNAKYYYEKYCLKKPDNLKQKYRLAELQYYTRDLKKSRINFSYIWSREQETYPLSAYLAARSWHMTASYDSAIVYYNAFLKKIKGDEEYYNYRKLCKTGIEGCIYAKEYYDSLQKIVVVHMDTSINKAYNEFSPVPVSKDTIWFAGISSDSLLPNEENITKQFYQAVKIDNSWVNTGLLSNDFNDPSVTTGNGSMSPSGVRFYFTRCYNNISEKKICNLYWSENENGKWGDPELLPMEVNDINYTSTQPSAGTYSKNMSQEIIYFISDRPEGKGGLDIWYTIFDKHTKIFSEARNAGSSINGPGDETTPFYDSDHRALYFSSESFPGYGGLDVFKSTGERKSWTAPVNMDRPINSSYDDIYFVNFDKESGFLVSNRDGGIAFANENCCDDIYSFRWTNYIHYAIAGNVREADNNETFFTPKENAIISLYIVDDAFEENLLSESANSDINGDFLMELEVNRKYKIVISAKGYFNKSYEFNTQTIDYSDTIYREFVIQKVPEKPIRLDNVYFEFNSANLTDSTKQNLDSTLVILLNDNPEIKIKVNAHTDSKGDDEYNLKLSEKRAASIVDYLVTRGITNNRLISQGYGESVPIAPNQNADGSDNPEGRQLNRRIEFTVIKKDKD